jgi:hypothetical protein
MNTSFDILFCVAVIIGFLSFANCEIFASSYSIQFLSQESRDITFQITVNGIAGLEKTISLESPSSDWFSFAASPGDTLSVNLPSYSGSNQFSYVINNRANGGGAEIYDSTSTTFTPVNVCQVGTCRFGIYGIHFANDTANVYANDTLVLSNYIGGTVEEFDVQADDLIRIEFNYVDGIDVYYTLYNSGAFINTWTYNACGINTQIYNSIYGPNRGPFGGSLYPITAEQSAEFASTLASGSQNSAWISLAE